MSQALGAAERRAFHRYTGVAIALHWAIALAIVGLIAMGWIMGDLPDGDPSKQALYQLHKSFGITVLLLTVARIAWRLLNPPPPLPEEMASMEKTASHAVHVGFYALMLLMPLTGWLYVSTAYEFQVPTVLFGAVSWPHLPFTGWLKTETGHGVVEFAHSKLAWVAIGLLVLHVAGAVKHEVMDEDGVLKRMVPGLFGRTDGPPRAARGALPAFGAAAALFALAAGAPLVANALGGGPDLATRGAVAANWEVDPDASEIRFSGVHDGDAFSGVFESWSADIAFDPDALDEAAAEIVVDTSSVKTGVKLYDDSLKAAEWFAVSAFPSATATLSNFRESGDGYQADATVAIKEASETAPLAFALDLDGDTATATGSVELTRSGLDLGQESDAGADWVGETVRVDLVVTAIRAD